MMRPNPLYRIQLLTGLQVQLGERTIARFSTQKAAALLAYLACHSGQTHPREVLIDMLWPDTILRAGRASLSQALSSLRRQLEIPGIPAGALIQTTYSTVGLNPDVITTDVAEFEAALRSAAQVTDSEQRARFLTEAVECYRGELLPGFYEDWVLVEQQRLADLHFQASRRLVAHLEQAGEPDRALDFACRVVAADPLREEAHCDLIRLYVATGQPAVARRQYRELERVLREELNTTPCATTRALVERLLREVPAIGGSDTPSKGQRKSPRRQKKEEMNASDSSFLPPPSFLPPQVTRFFGREGEIKRLAERLSSVTPPACRLATLSGAGGSGKTRLALEVAGRLLEAYSGAVWFVPLADLRDARQIPDAIADVLRLPRSPNVEPMEQVVEFLNGNGVQIFRYSGVGEAVRPPTTDHQPSSLLVLDNMEHLLAAERRKSEDGAAVVRALLDRVPTLTCLVTSRQPLGLSDEREFPVLPLPTPESEPQRHGDTEEGKREEGKGKSDSLTPNTQYPIPNAQHRTPAQLMQFSSVQLFVDRAQAVRPDFQVTDRNAAAIAELCCRLEGIPLAIELAAARAKVLTPAQMLAQLERRFDFLVSRKRDATERHRSLWAAVEWSYRLLSPDLRRFFARLSVFRGGWTVEAAQEVCEEPLALDYLEYLQEGSLVLAEETEEGMRFRMLETLREYAEEQLPLLDRTSIKRRHLSFFLALAEEAEPQLAGSVQKRWLNRLEMEHDNLRAALYGWQADASGDAMVGLRLAAALWRFWMIRGYLSEGRKWFSDTLSDSRACKQTKERSNALNGAGILASQQGDYTSARALCEESLTIERELGDKQGMASRLGNLGNVARSQADYVQARSLLEECLAVHQELGDRKGIALSLNNLAIVANYQGDYDAAQALNREALAIRRELGDKAGMADTLTNFGNLAKNQGDYASAHSLYAESLSLREELVDRHGIAASLHGLGAVAYHQGDYAEARSFYERALTMNRETGNRAWEANNLNDLGIVAHAQSDYASARALFKESLAIKRVLENKQGIAALLESLASLAAAETQSTVHDPQSAMQRGARLWGAAERLREEIGAPLPPNGREWYDQKVAAVQTALGEERFRRAWVMGKNMTMEQAIAYALEEVAA